jgi:hypothetical protein
MQTSEKHLLIEALMKGTVTVTFKKINSDEIRVMPCTLNPKVLEANGITTEVKSVAADSDHIATWALDKEAWRSFRTSTVLGWEVL